MDKDRTETWIRRFKRLKLAMYLAVPTGIAAVLVAAPVYTYYGGAGAKTNSVVSNISNIEQALEAFQHDVGRFPSTAEGLQPLMTQPAGVEKWIGPYLKRMPVDPWGNPYIYTCPGQHNPKGFDLYSYGPDGQAGGEDDITNWKQN